MNNAKIGKNAKAKLKKELEMHKEEEEEEDEENESSEDEEQLGEIYKIKYLKNLTRVKIEDMFVESVGSHNLYASHYLNCSCYSTR